MAACDICSAPGNWTIIDANNMWKAVHENGFDPFTMEIIKHPMVQRDGAAKCFKWWKETIVIRGDNATNWNICLSCMAKLNPYLKKTANPAGAKKANKSGASRVVTATKKVKQSKFWECQGCGTVLEKGLLDMLAFCKTITGTATCTNCGATYEQSDVYSGKYDVERC